MEASDAHYLQVVLDPLKGCAHYKPKFGQGAKEGGLTLKEFQSLYGGDPFYSWFGLDNPLMYAAHKAAGGMTSVYRQIGIGCEKLFRRVLMDELGLSPQEVVWSYQVPLPSGKNKTLRLDGRVPLDAIGDGAKRERFREWMRHAAFQARVNPRVFDGLTGTVFEIRQGYKSKDSKRQNADIANAAAAYANGYLPCAAILSDQIDADVRLRYRLERWAVMTGIIDMNDPSLSTYGFMREVVGYDLAAFFKRNSAILQAAIDAVLNALLAPKTT